MFFRIPKLSPELHPSDLYVWCRAIQDALKVLSLSGGPGIRLQSSSGGTTISATGMRGGGGGEVGFTGKIWIKGRFISLVGSQKKAWVRVYLDTATAAYNDGPVPDPFPPYEMWYEVANTHGNIVIP